MNTYFDVIIVGTGVAGCFAALTLPSDKKILMLTKAGLEDSDSFLAQGGICVLKDPSDYSSFFDDTLRAGHYENRRESVDIMIRSSHSIIEKLISYGVNFAHDAEGNLLYTREGAHSTPRILYHEDITGKEITSKLLASVKKRKNIQICEHTTMLDLLCRNNTCYGVLIKKDKCILPLYAPYTILASGGIGGIYDNTTNFAHLTGDAIAIALRRGITLEHINYVQIHPTTLYETTPGRRFLISESVRGEGAVLLNKTGERFVNELLPRDLLTKEIYRQMEKDQTPYVLLSMANIRNLDIQKRFPTIYTHCKKAGYDLLKDPIPVVPSQHYFMGGIHVDKNSKTSMEYLWAAGETSCNGVHGANRLASNSLLESLVFAERAANEIMQIMQSIPEREPIFFPDDNLFISLEALQDPANINSLFSSDKMDETSKNILKYEFSIDLTEYSDEKAYAKKLRNAIWHEINSENKKQKGSHKSWTQ